MKFYEHERSFGPPYFGAMVVSLLPVGWWGRGPFVALSGGVEGGHASGRGCMEPLSDVSECDVGNGRLLHCEIGACAFRRGHSLLP